MKKLLLSIMALMLSAAMFAEDVTFDFDNDYATLFPNLAGVSGTGSTDGDITETVILTSGDITMTINPAESGTATRIWSGSPRLRIYSGTFTIASSGAPITYVKFETGSNWNVTTATGTLDGKEWSGSAQSIDFAVSKNTQIKSVTISTEGGHVVLNTLYSIDFKASQDGWSIDNKSMDEALSYVWKANTSYGYVASAYVDNASHPSESWIVSPVFDLSKASGLELTINHAGNKFAGKVSDQVTYYASTDEGGTWNKLEVATWPAGNNWTFVESTVDIAAYAGKPSVMLAVAYVSTTESAGTYELDQFVIKGTGEISVKVPQTDGPVITPATGTYEEDQTVTITDPSGNDYTIYYTVDGSEPENGGENSVLYEGPFTVSETTTVKASTYDDDDNLVGTTTVVITINKTAVIATTADLIAACTATSQNDAPIVSFQPTNLLVTGVNGSNVFVQDAKGAFLLYGSASNLKKGDIVSGTIEGKLYSYNGLPELSVSDKWANIKVESNGNEVTATKVAAADITAADASRFVRFEGLAFESQETVSNKVNYTFSDDDGKQVVLRDNFNNLSGITFNSYSTYNLNVFVIPFRETIQYYAVSADDVEAISDLATPESGWASQHVVVTLGQAVDNTFKTNSDAKVVYTSSDTDVATISADGLITVVGAGVTTITATTDVTDKFIGDSKSFILAVTSGADGTADMPFGISDVKALYVDGDTVKSVWIKAYIVGYANGAFNAEKVVFGSEEALASNILIAASADETDYQNCIPVALENKPATAKAVRDTLNLQAHPENLGREVWLKGSIVKYFGVAGVKSVEEMSFTQPVAAEPEDVNGDGTVDTQDVLAVYEFMQNQKEGDEVGNFDVNGDGAADTQDVLVIYEKMQKQ